MKLKRFAVTAVDYASKTPEVRAVCSTEDEAKNFTIEDMREYADRHANADMVFDDERLRITDDDLDLGCEWNIEDVEIELTEDEEDKIWDDGCQRRLADGHIRCQLKGARHDK